MCVSSYACASISFVSNVVLLSFGCSRRKKLKKNVCGGANIHLLTSSLPLPSKKTNKKKSLQSGEDSAPPTPTKHPEQGWLCSPPSGGAQPPAAAELRDSRSLHLDCRSLHLKVAWKRVCVCMCACVAVCSQGCNSGKKSRLDSLFLLIHLISEPEANFSLISSEFS